MQVIEAAKSIIKSKVFSSIWELMITLLSFFLALVIPFELALGLWDYHFYLILEIIVTIIFFLDIAFSIYSCYLHLDFRYVSRKEKLYFYLRNWFIFDLIAVIPFSLFANPLFLIFRLFKLVRVSRILEDFLLKNLRFTRQLSLLIFIFSMLLITHWISCGWLVIRGLEKEVDIYTNYINALYWSVTTITTVGYGDITPITNAEKLYTILTMLVGLGFYGFLIGNIASLLTEREPAREHYEENLKRLSNIVKYRSLPTELEHKVHEYYNYKLQRQMGYDESDFLQTLPANLQRTLALHLKKDLLERIPLFQHGSEAFIEAIALHLKPIVLTPGDYIFRAGDMGHEMYFIIRGQLRVVAKDQKRILSTMSDGDFFGEIALFLHKPRTASIIAESYCDLYSLSQQAFEEVIQHYPYFAQTIEEMVKSREKK